MRWSPICVLKVMFRLPFHLRGVPIFPLVQDSDGIAVAVPLFRPIPVSLPLRHIPQSRLGTFLFGSAKIPWVDFAPGFRTTRIPTTVSRWPEKIEANMVKGGSRFLML